MNETKPTIWNLPNALTMARMAMVPLFAWVLLSHPHDQTWRVWATVVFLVAILTDLADGRIARARDQVTDFGKLWDPVADKALTGMAFIGLGILGELYWWLIAIILLREWGITAIRAGVRKYGIIAANRGGKLKTVMQSVALPMFLLWLERMPPWFGVLAWVCMWVAFALTVVTGVEYIWEAARLRRDARSNR